MDEGGFRCGQCGDTRLVLSADAVVCRGCAAHWPVRNDVPDFFNQYALAGGDGDAIEAEEAAVETLMRVLDLDDDGRTRSAVRDIVQRSHAWSCENRALSAEINELMERFAPPESVPPLPQPSAQANGDAEIVYERHYFRPSYAAGSSFSANVRVRNEGAQPWSSRTGRCRTLAAWWCKGGKEPGELATECRFPVDVEAGASMTLPLQLVAPARGGKWTLIIGLAENGARLTGAAVTRVEIEVGRQGSGWGARMRQLLPAGGPAPVDDGKNHALAMDVDYGKDHALAVDMVKAWAGERERVLGRRARVLEVGSGTHPQTAWLEDLEVLAVDISSPILELGSLYFKRRFADRLGFICADAFDLPLTPGRFDAVAIFSALHHFSAPDELLRSLAMLLGEEGRIFVMCEPVGDALDGVETIRDLAKGINEQVFSRDEYGLIFARAGLSERFVRVDGCSLKAVLARM
jgi:SAM-dependent methyltransferase